MALVKDAPVVNLGALSATATFGVEDANLFSFQFYGTGSLTLTFEYSNDGTNWAVGQVVNIMNGSAITTLAFSGAHNAIAQSNSFRATTAYVRARISSYSSGSTNVKFISSRYGI